jgi:hypothetical protein
MNADLTFNSIVFEKSFDEKDGSERRSSARGINIPDILSIKSQDYVDSETKVPGRRFTGRVDRVNVDSVTGQRYVVSFYFVCAIPQLAVTGDLTALNATFKAAVADANFIADIQNNEK